jgi:predicted phosphatase
MMFENYIYFYFDLDRNIFDTFDKYNNPIWARQMIPPFKKINDYTIEDDCLSKCFLQKGVREYFNALIKHEKKISYISKGGNLNISKNSQPSKIILDLFDLTQYINHNKILLHKSNKKTEHIKNTNKLTIFFDDSFEELHEMSIVHPKIKCINRASFVSWTNLL